MRVLLASVGGLVATLLLPLLLIAAMLGSLTTANATTGTVDTSAIPPAAAQHLDTIVEVTATACPELPPVWVIAHVQAESSWDPAAFSPDRNGGAAGLYQLNEANWTDAGGVPWTSTPPAADDEVLQADGHLRRAIPWICGNLRTVTAHLDATGKPSSPLDALLVCHIAGCGRVTGSATGIPTAGEAGCGTTCADLVATYVERVHDLVGRYTATGGPVPVDGLQVPTPFTGSGTGCTRRTRPEVAASPRPPGTHTTRSFGSLACQGPCRRSARRAAGTSTPGTPQVITLRAAPATTSPTPPASSRKGRNCRTAGDSPAGSAPMPMPSRSSTSSGRADSGQPPRRTPTAGDAPTPASASTTPPTPQAATSITSTSASRHNYN